MSLWYLARATGAVTLILLTLTVAIGIANQQRWAPRRTPRFVVEHLHRSTSLLVVVLLAVHIAASVIDGYVQIRLVDAVVPFLSSYQPLWLGLGTLAFDLLLALIVTSVLRAHIGARTWRAVHWAAYVCWPVALAHGLGIGTDTGTTGWLTWLSVGCTAVVLAAVWARLTRQPAPLAAPVAPTVPPVDATRRPSTAAFPAVRRSVPDREALR
ncbi:ferric reductase-like transmembrane domain-containing protein [Patulibacter sp.]|uniref:ferric reductase-like transmembrane domain-containing protein n=1 Tax=Patulibacter sp. TaxID=1912859 RepID=UPI002720ECD5|nr:ferric reductase-like transmembrane domain-containing protein [Patulibacter sp.]MDO9408967.1 ferric reductase-like transmembrane domain-containing protein [Patulibacter sp.]